MLAFAYELKPGDRILEEGGAVQIPKNGVSITDDDVIVTLADRSTREYRRDDFLDIERVLPEPVLKMPDKTLDLIVYAIELQVGDLLVTDQSVPVLIAAPPVATEENVTVTLADGSVLPPFERFTVLEIQRDVNRIAGGAENITHV